MTDTRKSLLDNWSLEHAGTLLNGDTDIAAIPKDRFINNFGGLSNYINALLLYDEANYLSNGFEKDWTGFEWFTENTICYVKGLPGETLQIDWNSTASYSDQGISNYLKSSDSLGLDLFVSPERSTKLKQNIFSKTTSTLESIFKSVDKKILSEAEGIWLPETQLGIVKNFMFPSLTQYVLSETSRADELFTIILQLKEDGKINRVINELNEIARNTKKAGQLQREIETRIKLAFGDKSKSDTSFTLKLSALFISLNKTLSFNFFNRREHFLFLNDIVACRSESENLKKSINRIFKQIIE